MYLLNFEQWVSVVFVDALGATFAHSLWQALIALILCHIAFAVAKKASPALRYKLLLGISLLLGATVVITFFIQINSSSVSKDILVNYVPLQDLLNRSGGTATPVVLQSQRFLSLASDFLTRYMDVLVALWFIIFSFKWLRITLGLNYIKRIARFESSVADQYWVDKLAELKRKLGITKTVKLLKSNIIKMPVATGFFRPVIIVPVSLFSNMSPDLVESILLHELAHIKRRDYLVNLLQSAAETVFFFNPFILKISSLIKDERENCCDSVAVEVVQNKVSYVEALVAFGEYSNKTHTAVAFAGRKKYLLQRVKRILYNQNKKPGVMEKSILVCGVILFLGLAVFSTVKGTEKVFKSPLVNTYKAVVADTIPSEKSGKIRKPSKREIKRAERTMKEHEEKIEKKQQELQIAVEAMQEDLRKSHELKDEKEIEIQNEKIKELLEKNELKFKNEFNFKNNLSLEQNDLLKKAQIDALHKQLELIRVEQLEQNDLFKKAQIDALHKQLELIRVEQIKPALQLALDQKIQAQIMAQNAVNLKLHHHMFDSLTNNIKVNINAIGPFKRDEVAEILIFLEKNNVSKRGDIKSFSLNENELKVNDVKQPAELHEQLKKKYIESKGDHINYLRNGNGTMISIQRNRPDPV